MKQLLIILCSMMLLLPVAAQDTPTPITADNATSLEMLYSVGSPLPGKLVFSPDDRYIIASTTEQTLIYESDNLEATPKILPFTDFTFDEEGFLVADSKRWNLDTGLSVGIVPTIRVLPISDSQPTNVIEVVKAGGEVVRLDTGYDYEVLGTAVNDGFTRLAVALQRDGVPTVYLYDLSSNVLIASLPQNSRFIRNLVFVRQFLVSDFWQPQALAGVVEVYDAESGRVSYPPSGQSAMGVYISEDRQVIGYDNDQQAIVVIDQSSVREFPYTSDKDDYGYPPAFAIGNHTFAIVNDNTIELADDENTITKIAIDEAIFGLKFTQNDDWLIGFSSKQTYLWEVSNPQGQPSLLSGDYDSNIEISNDGLHYIYEDQRSAKRFLTLVSNNEIVVELPIEAILDSKFSKAVYWDDGQVVVTDIETQTANKIDIIANYRGQVMGFDPQTQNIIFQSDAVSFTNLTSQSQLTLNLPQNVRFGGFSADHNLMLFFSSSNPSKSILPYLAIWNAQTGKLVEDFNVDSLSGRWTISSTGEYLTQTAYACNNDYGDPSEAKIYRVSLGKFDHMSDLISSVDTVCNSDYMVFNADDSILNLGSGAIIYSLELKAVTQSTFLWGDREYALLDYGDEDYTTFDLVVGVGVSNDDYLAVTLEERSGNESLPPLGYRVELFAIADLQPNTKRFAVQPLRIIPDATFATFSPDSQYVVTDKGLYPVDSRYVNRSINGTISTFSADSQLLATYQDGNVTLWSVSNPTPLAQYEIRNVRQLAFSEDGTRLYVVRDGDVQVWGVSD